MRKASKNAAHRPRDGFGRSVAIKTTARDAITPRGARQAAAAMDSTETTPRLQRRQSSIDLLARSQRRSARPPSRLRRTVRRLASLRRLRSKDAVEAHVNLRMDQDARWTVKEYLLGHVVGQFVMLFVIAVILVWAGTLAWIAACTYLTPRRRAKTPDYNTSVIQALWFSWGVFFDPGTQTGIVADEYVAVKVVAVAFSVVGFLFNLVLLGLIVERVKIFLDRMVETYGKIVCTKHILVLGWTDRTLFLLGELAEMAQGNAAQKRTTIVVLGDLSPAEQRAEIRQAFPSWRAAFPAVDVVCRQGRAYEVEDLARVSAQAADTLVILGASRIPRDADAQTISTVLALRALPAAPKSKLIAEFRLSQSTHVFDRVGGDRKLVPILAATVVDAALVRCALVPPVGAVALDLLSFEGQNIEMIRADRAGCGGRTFEDVRRHFRTAVVLGLASKEKKSVVLAPPDDRLVVDDDLVVCIAEDQTALSDISERATPRVTPQDVLRRAAGLTGRRRLETIPVDVPRVDVALVGWNDRVVPLLRELDRHVASGSVVHVLSERRLDERERSLKEEGLTLKGESVFREDDIGLRNVTLDHVVGFATDVSQLRRLPLATLEAAIVMADIDQNAVQSTSGAELQLADSETITSTLLLRDMHERCRAKGKAESPLVIVPQFLDVLTTRVFKRHPGLLEEESDANAMVGEDSSDDDAAAPGSAFGVGRTLCVHRNFLETAALTSSALSIYGAMALRALLGLDEALGRRAVGPPRLRVVRCDACLERPSIRPRAFDDLNDAVRRKYGALMVGCCVEINPCVGCSGIASRRRVDGVEDDATIQHERAVKF